MVTHRIKLTKKVFRVVNRGIKNLEMIDDKRIYLSGQKLELRRWYPLFRVYGLSSVTYKIKSIRRVMRNDETPTTILFYLDYKTPNNK